MIYYNGECIFNDKIVNYFTIELLEIIDNIFDDMWFFPDDETIICQFIPSEQEIEEIFYKIDGKIDINMEIITDIWYVNTDKIITPCLKITKS